MMLSVALKLVIVGSVLCASVGCGGAVSDDSWSESSPREPRTQKLTAPLDQTFAIRLEGLDDRTAPADGKIRSDGQPDAVFAATLDKPVLALALLTTDASGNPSDGQQWDSMVDDDVITVASDERFVKGGWTWQLAVARPDGTVLNEHDGRLGIAAGVALGSVRLYASDSGYFRSGVHLRLFATLPDGSVVGGPTYAYDGPVVTSPVVGAR